MTRPTDRRPADDAGVTTIELIVGMLVMVVFMTIFTGAVVSMATSINKVEAVTTSSQQTNTAFLKLDRLIRYSSAITTMGTGASGDWYVEIDTIDNDAAIETCTQLRVDIATKQLQKRTWTATGATTYTSLSSWVQLASSITNGAVAQGSADQPFTTPPALAAAATSFQRLTITLVAGTAGASSPTTTRSNMTFTALNSSASATTNATRCQQLGAVSRP